MDTLQTVIRSSMDMPRMTGPAYSMACPTAPAAPILAMTARMTSLAATPKGRAPFTVIRITLGFLCQRHCVASTCSTSVEPMPKASAPKAPWVAVWESPHTRTIPGWVSPCSGPMTCTIPWRTSPRPNCVMPSSRELRARASTMPRISSLAEASEPAPVGT